MPYNPEFASAGLPAEQVGFTVGRSSSTSIACTIEVWHSGKFVGSTSIEASAAVGHSSSLSMPVSIKGSTFAGKLSDAHVTCHIS
jgi:hypothetical protein